MSGGAPAARLGREDSLRADRHVVKKVDDVGLVPLLCVELAAHIAEQAVHPLERRGRPPPVRVDGGLPVRLGDGCRGPGGGAALGGGGGGGRDSPERLLDRAVQSAIVHRRAQHRGAKQVLLQLPVCREERAFPARSEESGITRQSLRQGKARTLQHISAVHLLFVQPTTTRTRLNKRSRARALLHGGLE